MAYSLIKITHTETATDMANILQAPSGNEIRQSNNFERYFNSLAGGFRNATVLVGVDAVQASGTLTLTSVVATNTCVINGVTFTAIASGATGNQFNVGANDTATAVNLAAAINASVTAKVSGYVTATSASTVVTVTAVQPGLSGNLFTLTGSTNIVASAAALAGGTAGTEVSYSF